MKCSEVVEWMHRYLDYDLSDEETIEMSQHLAHCPECAETFRMLKSLSRDLEDLPKVAPRFSLVDAIMPQLDAIDQARQEKSASVEEIPAQMKPVPMRQERKSSFRNSIAGRTAVGAVAAAIILGVAIYSYTPKQLSNADEQLSSTQDRVTAANQQPVTSSDIKRDASTETSAESTVTNPTSNPDQQGTENKMYTGSADGGSKKDSPGLNSAPTSEGKGSSSKTDLVTHGDNKSTTSDPKGDKAGKQADPNSLKSNGKMSMTPPSSSVGDSSSDTAKTDAGMSVTSVGNNDQTPISENTPDPNSTATNPGNGNEKDTPEFSIRASFQPLVSPDGKYSAVVEEKKLVIYSVSKDTTPNKVVRSFDLVGTWASGVWSADSTVFTYQTTDATGATTNQAYQVNTGTTDK